MSKVTMSVTWEKYGNGYIGQWIRSDAITGTASFEVSPQGGLTGGWNWSFVHSGYTVGGGARTEDEAKRMCEAAYRGIFESEILGDGRWEKVIVFTDRIRIERGNFKAIVDKFTGDCKLYKNREPLDNMTIDANQDDGGMIRAAVDWAQSVIENHESSANTDGEDSVECILFPVEYLKEIEDILLSNGGEGMALTIRSALDDVAMLKAKPVGWAENEHKVIMPIWDESNPRRHRPIGELLNEEKKKRSMTEYDKNSIEMPGEFAAAVSSGRHELLRSLRNNVLEGTSVLSVQQQARLIDYVADSIKKLGDGSSDAVRLQDKLHDIQRGLDGLGTMTLRALEIAEELE